jgi:superfamily II DNA or RNA helicase
VEVTTAGTSGPAISEHEILRDGESQVYFRDHLTDEALLAGLNDALRLELDGDSLRRVLSIGIRSEAKRLSTNVRHEPDQDKKLLMLAGVDALRGELPAGAVSLAERRRGRKLEDTEIAAMARMSKGAALVERLRPAIEDRGLDLPALSGGSQARATIRELGLSEEFAGSRTRSREPRFEVLGPITLPKLHDYQAKVVENLLSVLRPGGKNRGLVALPTGSGKTRVAVEALIRFVHVADSEPLILWIAQSDELCEQAVDAWRYAWSAIAPAGKKLTVSRLWGANDATPVEDGVHLVVATDDKLASLSGKGQHEWLTDADVVLVDEAHTSISPTYTKLFEWLKRSVTQRDRALLGLSATPYRGNNEAQTKTLVNRYDSNLLTEGVLGEDPYRELQEMGILARVRHQELDGMVLTPSKNAKRTDSDAVHFDDYRIDLSEVAGDKHRNEQILNHLESLSVDMTALVFAASVPHAEILAAVLAGSGIPSASIDAYTPPRERRRLIERFRAGDVRVLTNYNVLSQGFDAPKVGAVYVTRPTFSPNRYQQMIGRGLRGPKNGGSEEVLIVNVRDNIEAFGTQLAFTHFNKLWTGGG